MALRLFRHVAIWIAVAIALFPILWMLAMAFKPMLEWTAAGGSTAWLPKEPSWGNFEYIFYGQTDAFPASTMTEKHRLETASGQHVDLVDGDDPGNCCWLACGIWLFPNPVRWELAVHSYPASDVSAARRHDPDLDHVGLSQHDRHMVGADTDLCDRDAALCLLVDADFPG